MNAQSQSENVAEELTAAPEDRIEPQPPMDPKLQQIINGLEDWVPVPGQPGTFKKTVTMKDGTPAVVQGQFEPPPPPPPAPQLHVTGKCSPGGEVENDEFAIWWEVDRGENFIVHDKEHQTWSVYPQKKVQALISRKSPRERAPWMWDEIWLHIMQHRRLDLVLPALSGYSSGIRELASKRMLNTLVTLNQGCA
jgi:hypothetical protein